MRARTLIAIVCTAAAGLVALPAAGVAATITVNDSGDAVADVGDCTLREAIESANDNTASGATANECPAGEPGATARDVIEFALSVGDRVIQPATQLPAFTDLVEIDGRNGAAGARIELDGSTAPANAHGLFLTTGSDGSYVHHVAVHGFGEDGLTLFSNANVAERIITGTDLSSSAGIGNGVHGIDVLGDDNLIDGVVASGNGTNGINVDFRADRTSIVSSRIGANRDGTSALANHNYGIALGVSSLESADETTIGGTTGLTPGGACSGDCNLISGNTVHGIHAQSAGAPITGLLVRGNHIGVADDGSAALGNGRAGVALAGDVPAAVVRENVISANGDDGISITSVSNAGFDLAPRDVVVAGNRIGVDASGTAVLGNGGYGIEARSDITSGFDPLNGLVIGGAEGLTPGGPCTGDCNVVGGAQINGISLGGPVVDAKVLGNHLGADATGTGAVPNTQSGLTLSGTTRAVVGSPAAPNVISGNGMVGLDIFDQSTANVVQSNLIGVAADGTSPLANGEGGVRVFAVSSGTTIGGLAAGAGNEIAHNAESGIEVLGGGSPESTAPILGNAIHSNGELGIDLRPDGITGGVTPNDGPGDADGGGNGSLNFPVLDTVAAVGTTTLVRGSIATLPGRTLRLELFASASADPSGHGEGETPLGAFEVTTNGGGTSSFTEQLAGTAAAGKRVTATATLLGGGGPEATSEFSAAIAEGCDISGTPGPDALTGGPADEVICGLAGDDVVAGGGGADLIVGGPGADLADYSKAGGPLDASLATGDATESGVTDELLEIEGIIGSGFADRLTGGAGPDALDGLGGDDVVDGAGGDDALAGGEGDDEVSGLAGDDVLAGDAGNDDLAGDEGTDTVEGGAGSDDVEGGSGADLVKGGGGAKDDVSGQGGSDSVKGGGGKKDDVRGGGGKDKLDGGGGKKDSCNGGSGKDRKSAPGCETKKSLG